MQKKADFGIAFDRDGDRVMFVNDKGQVVDGDDILYIISMWYHRTGRLRGGVISTVMTNLGYYTRDNSLSQTTILAGGEFFQILRAVRNLKCWISSNLSLIKQ